MDSADSIASSEDADFERESSQNGLSSFTLKTKKDGATLKKFVISKDKVNFKKGTANSS